jgi:EAL domain-containing protein (putative c-di-GMP-specific phosphodiesterase class I)
VAISEVGDCFCPVFRLSELDFDYAFMDVYSVKTLGDDSAERIAGSLAEYLHRINVKVIAPGLDTEEKVVAAKRVGVDGYTEESLAYFNREDASSDE